MIELAPLDAESLCPPVEPIDSLVRRRHQQRPLGAVPAAPPFLNATALHLVAGSSVEAALLVVDDGDVGVATTEAKACLAFPVVGEAMDPVELCGVEPFDEMAEHAASPNGGELQRIADECEPPSLIIGKLSERSEACGGHHAGLVDNDGGSCRQVVAMLRRSSESVLDDQLVKRVGVGAGLICQHGGGVR
ncbi:MAG: hypothetical protein WKF45_05805 [Ilumatobacteraceae bacterium]